MSVKNPERLVCSLLKKKEYTKDERNQFYEIHKMLSEILKTCAFPMESDKRCYLYKFLIGVYKCFKCDLKDFVQFHGDQFSDFNLMENPSKKELDNLVSGNFWFRALIGRSRDLIAYKLDSLSVEESFLDLVLGGRCGFWFQWFVQLIQFSVLAIIIKWISGYMNKAGLFKRVFGEI